MLLVLYYIIMLIVPHTIYSTVHRKRPLPSWQKWRMSRFLSARALSASRDAHAHSHTYSSINHRFNSINSINNNNSNISIDSINSIISINNIKSNALALPRWWLTRIGSYPYVLRVEMYTVSYRIDSYELRTYCRGAM